MADTSAEEIVMRSIISTILHDYTKAGRVRYLLTQAIKCTESSEGEWLKAVLPSLYATLGLLDVVAAAAKEAQEAIPLEKYELKMEESLTLEDDGDHNDIEPEEEN